LKPLRISCYTLCTALGDGREPTLQALRERRTGLAPNDFGATPIATWIGRVRGLEEQPLPAQLVPWDCRNNRLAWRGLLADGFRDAVLAARDRYGTARIAVVMGTSTSSIGASEEAYSRLDADGRYPIDLRRPIIHTPHSIGDFVQHALGLEGISVTVATACSSSAKVFAQAERLMRTGLADAAVVGGVDTLCGSVLFGFNSLELVSPDPCRPFDVERRGINLGEAAGFALLERASSSGPWLIGHGESSDAHHMSTPHPEGAGARAALAATLDRAEIRAADVDYINLHGTASLRNDEVEAAVVKDAFPAHTIASSTKGWTGHTLGAAGIVEAAISLLALERDVIPGTLNTRTLDPACGPQIHCENTIRETRRALSFSFGFGGSNCVLAFARSDAL
jgi:3-oxoacyl-[acyl-carrier-protein] synthase-1